MKNIPISYHPWEFLQNELETRGRDSSNFAQMINISEEDLNKIIQWKKSLTPQLAYSLAIAFDEPIQTWMRLQADWDTYQVIKNDQEEHLARWILQKKQKVFA